MLARRATRASQRQEEALNALESRSSNPRAYTDPVRSAKFPTGVNKILTRFAAVRFEPAGDTTELILRSLHKLDEPPALLAWRTAVTAVLSRVDLPEILLEIAARTGFYPRHRTDRPRNGPTDQPVRGPVG
jgi:hypothetical protein